MSALLGLKMLVRYASMNHNTVDLIIFASFSFSRISRKGRIREFKNRAKIIIIIALLKNN